jgi:inorganic pyrophosphatase
MGMSYRILPSARAHPWHGVHPGPKPPRLVTAYIEITPRDVVKYELDKVSGLLKVDRPQQTSSSPPTLYGLIPQTYCGKGVAALSPETDVADGDPLDICVFSERPIDRADIVLPARVLGGLRMIDGGEADDKIVAVLANDRSYEHAETLSDLPTYMIDRLEHYFLTYKMIPGSTTTVVIEERYEAEHAHRVVEAAIADYKSEIAGIDD